AAGNPSWPEITILPGCPITGSAARAPAEPAPVLPSQSCQASPAKPVLPGPRGRTTRVTGGPACPPGCEGWLPSQAGLVAESAGQRSGGERDPRGALDRL